MRHKQKFSLRARIKSSTHAWRGIGILFTTSHNAWAGIVVALLAIYMGYVLNISATEWMFLVSSIALVFITETINSAIEVDIDLTSPEIHPYARDTKDIAAGAVLMSIILSLIIAAIIFLPKIF